MLQCSRFAACTVCPGHPGKPEGIAVPEPSLESACPGRHCPSRQEIGSATKRRTLTIANGHDRYSNSVPDDALEFVLIFARCRVKVAPLAELIASSQRGDLHAELHFIH